MQKCFKLGGVQWSFSRFRELRTSELLQTATATQLHAKNWKWITAFWRSSELQDTRPQEVKINPFSVAAMQVVGAPSLPLPPSRLTSLPQSLGTSSINEGTSSICQTGLLQNGTQGVNELTSAKIPEATATTWPSRMETGSRDIPKT